MPRLTMRERIFGSTEDRTLTKESVPPVMLKSIPAGSITPNNGLDVADVYACVRALADAAASLPLVPYQRDSSGRKRLPDTERVSELLLHPAPATTQAAMIGQAVAHLNCHGNAYVGKFREGEEVVQLGLLAPDRVQVERRAGQPIYHYAQRTGERLTLTTRDVVHIKGLSTDGMLGLSPIRQARVALGLSGQLTEHASYFFANDARPSGVLKVKRFAGSESEDMDELKAGFNAEHAGAKNAHKIAVLAGDVDFVPFSIPLDDAQFLDQRKLSAVEVARIFRVPPWMIGADAGASKTYSNVEQEALHFVTYSLRPWLVCIEQALSGDPDLFLPHQYCEFLLDALLRADSKIRSEVYTRALDPITGWMTRAEVRERENLDPEPDGPPESPAAAAVASALAGMNGNGNGDG